MSKMNEVKQPETAQISALTPFEKKTEQLSIRVPESLHNEIKAFCSRNGTSQNQAVVYLLVRSFIRGAGVHPQNL